jgi:hypothetical protein
MLIPIDLFLQNINEQKIYCYSSIQLNTKVPHYFICVKRLANGQILQLVCTSQEQKAIKRIEILGLPYETLVWIKPSLENGLQKDTYVSCNQVFISSIEDFKLMYQKQQITSTGELSEADFEQLRLGILASPEITDETKEFFN